MSVKGTFYCDAPDCETHGGAQDGHMRPPVGFLTVHESATAVGGGDMTLHFCGWECALKFAATIEPPTIIPWGHEGGER